MKKILLLALALSSATAFSQNEKHEVKANVASLILGFPEITYEYMINQNSAAGISTAISVGKWDTTFMITPYYRAYFGNQVTDGIFVEAGLSLFNQKYDDDVTKMEEQATGFGAGVVVGYKVITVGNFVAEAFGGIGRNLINTDVLNKVYPRFGVTIGKKF